MTGLVLAIAVAARAPAAEALLTIGAVHQPTLTGIAVLGLVATSRFRAARSEPVDPAVGVVVSVAGDLRAGKTLRAVLASGALGESLASLAGSGRPIHVGPDDLSSMFGPDTFLVQATLDLAVEGGGPAANAFDRLAADMIEAERTRRERRAALAPVVAQAVIVGGAPLVLLGEMVLSGRWLTMLSAGLVSATIVLFGSVAVLVGVLWIAALVYRGRTRWL